MNTDPKTLEELRAELDRWKSLAGELAHAVENSDIYTPSEVEALGIKFRAMEKPE